MFDTVAFYAAVVVATLVSASLPAAQVRLRALLLALVSLGILRVAADVGWKELLFIVAAAAWATIAASLARKASEARPFTTFALVFAPIAAPWFAGKLASSSAWPHFFAFVGFSFFFIKAWTLIKDVQDKRIELPDPLVAFAYFLFFPTYVAGPMHLFDEYDQSIRKPEMPDAEGFVDAMFRIALGLLKVKILAPLLLPLGLDSFSVAHRPTPAQLVIAAFVYSFIIFWNFSGYSDLAVGTAKLIGIKTPENFASPYLAPNLREFWQRWHISFSRVLTSYVFVPLSRSLGRWIGDRPRLIMVIAYLVTFVFCGFWHGPTPNFLLWGLYHAVGLILSDIYRAYAVKQRRKRKGKPLLPSPLGRILATAFTFAFVSLGWVLFALPVRAIFGG